MKHFVVIANAYKDRNFALTNKIVAYIEQKGRHGKGAYEQCRGYIR